MRRVRHARRAKRRLQRRDARCRRALPLQGRVEVERLRLGLQGPDRRPAAAPRRAGVPARARRCYHVSVGLKDWGSPFYRP
jgi:hypothetical protein